MAQHGNEHLTTIQLSAYLDRELPADELAACSTHLASCQVCQAALADLRLTASLLRRLPEVEVPRSFVLSAEVALLPLAPASRPGGVLLLLRKAARPFSALAAIVGVLLILLGAISGVLPAGTYPSTTAAPAASGNSALQATADSAAGHVAIPSPSLASGLFSPTAQETARPATTGAPLSTATPVSTSSAGGISNAEPPALNGPPAIVDPAQPAGRAALGTLLLILGLAGLFFTRQQDRSAPAALNK